MPSTVNTSWPYFYAGQQPAIPGTIGSAPIGLIDQNAGRPARQIQWSIGVQREIIPNVMVDLSYVGNRGAWWQANSLIDINRLTPSILAAHNIDPTTAAGNSLLTGPLSAVLGTPTAAADHITLPYAGFPTNRSVAQALRPFPAFGSISERWAPDGDTWYDALQMRVTKRFSHGLAATYTFAFQKEETIGAESEDNGFGGGPGISDVLNRSLNKTISSFFPAFAERHFHKLHLAANGGHEQVGPGGARRLDFTARCCGIRAACRSSRQVSRTVSLQSCCSM